MTALRYRRWAARLLLAGAATAALAGRAGADMLVESTFHTSDEGWGVIEGTTRWVGNEIEYSDSAGGLLAAVAPAKFLGDLSAFNGGLLSLTVQVEQGNPNAQDPHFGTVTIKGAAGSASLDVIPPPDFGGLNTAPLTADAWGLAPSAWAALLANVTSLTINLEWSNSSRIPDKVLLQHFSLYSPVPEPGSFALTGVGLAGLAAGAWRRRRRPAAADGAQDREPK